LPDQTFGGKSMHKEPKSLGGALVDVFDAGMTLVKAEIRAVGKQVGNVAKAKGLGLVLLLAAVGPLLLGLIFLILAVFYLLMALGLPAWAAALIIALVGFALTGALIMMGMKKLSAEVPNDDHPRLPHTEDDHLEAQYQAEQAARAAAASATTAGRATVVSTTAVSTVTAPLAPAGSTNADTRHPHSQPQGYQGSMGQGGGVATDTPDQRQNVRSGGLPHTDTAANSAAARMEEDRQRGVVRGGLSTSGFTAGDPGVNTSDQGAGLKTPLTAKYGESQGTAIRGSDAGEVRLPVYEAGLEGEPQVYGSGLNKKLDGSETHGAGQGGHDKKHDPNIQHPVVLKDAPGISVSTEPTFREDMKKEGY